MDLGRLGRLTLAVASVAGLCAAGTVCAAAAEPAGRQFVQAGAAAPFAPGQDDRAQESDRPGKVAQNIFPPPDRATLRLLRKARQLIDQDRYAEAVRCLGAIFDSPQDYFFHPDKSDPVPRSLKSEAWRLLGEMSHRGRQLYELQYGARARRMLAEAAAAGDAAALAEVSRRYFHTQAGYEATLLVGIHHLDHGRPLAGALALERLGKAPPAVEQFEPALSLAIAICWVRAGYPDKAAQTLSKLEARQPEASIQVAGRQVRLFADNTDVLEWLTGLVGTKVPLEADQPAQWVMFRGNAARNMRAGGGGPLLSRRWRVSTSDHPYVEALIEQLRDSDREWDRSALPALHPVVVDDVVLMRTARNLLAVDLETGKRIWETPVDNPFETLFSPPRELLHRRSPQWKNGLRLRLWADATYGSISSDGRCVFAIEDLGLEIGSGQFHSVFIGGQRAADPAGPKPYNRLAAYEIRTGKLKWELGGPGDKFALPQAGTFFLGPPLPLMGRLYVIAESMGEIRLLALESKTGALVWSQQLAGTDQLLLRDPLRRMAGLSPSYADGILVCPTSNRSIVAVELATRSLRWGYTYAQAGSRSQRQVVFMGTRSIMDPDPAGRWIDSSVVLADGRVLVTPVDSDYLHCLDLFDGRLLWKESRQDDLYLACLYEGTVVLIGKRRVRAVDLHRTRDSTLEELSGQSLGEPRRAVAGEKKAGVEQGEFARPAPAWGGRTLKFPSGTSPCGTGFLSGHRYYVPLSTGEVMAVDLNTGRSAQVFRSRYGNVPGNLISCGGRIISQDATGLEAFDQLEALREEVDRRLAATSEDPEALLLRGDILWDEGKLDEAIRCFRRSLQLRPDPDAARLLRDALLEGLRVQFATQRHDAEEIQGLIEEPAQQATYLRLMAVGLAGAGEFHSAWEHYLKLIELDTDHRGMEPVEESLSARRDRWIQLQLAALRESAPVEVRAAIDQDTAARLKAAVDAGIPEPIQHFLEYFGAQPIAREARRNLVRRFEEAGQLLGAELLLKRQERSSRAEARGAAVAELAEMLHRSEHWHDAAICYARLNRELADVVCVEAKTGRELVEALPADDPVRVQLQPGLRWPTGEVVVTKSKPKAPPQPTYNQAPLTFHQSRGPFFLDVTVELHQAPLPELVARDGLGHQKWRLPLAELGRPGDFLLSRGLMRVAACGHLLLITSGQRILAVDTLGTTDQAAPRLLWSRDLGAPHSDPFGRGQLRVQLANLAAGMPQVDLAGYIRNPVNVPRIVNEQILCFKRLHHLIAADPWTGKTLWMRRNIPRDSELFGDHEYVFLLRPEETTATVLRALDGKMLGTREVPRERKRFYGRRVLVWRDAGGRRVLEMVDPWDNKKLWPPEEFAADAALHYVGQDSVAVYEPGARFVLVDLNNGRPIIDCPLQAQPSLSEILVLPSPDGYLLILYQQSLAASQVRRTFEVRGVASVRITQGQVYAFDPDGNQRWPSPVTVEDQWLPLSQPSRLPVLTFACMVQEPRPNVWAQPKTSILCLDKRSGREICREQFSGVTNCFFLVGDPQTKTVEIRLQRDTLTMKFTDQPPAAKVDRADDPPDQASSTPPKAMATTRALLRAIQAALIRTPSGSNQP